MIEVWKRFTPEWMNDHDDKKWSIEVRVRPTIRQQRTLEHLVSKIQKFAQKNADDGLTEEEFEAQLRATDELLDVLSELTRNPTGFTVQGDDEGEIVTVKDPKVIFSEYADLALYTEIFLAIAGMREKVDPEMGKDSAPESGGPSSTQNEETAESA